MHGGWKGLPGRGRRPRSGALRTARALTLSGLLTMAGADRATPSAAPDLPEPTELSRCEEIWARAPGERASARCFRDAARIPELRDRATRRMEALLEEHPDDAWLPFYLAAAEWSRRTQRVPDLFARSAAAFRRRNDAAGEVEARCWNVQFLDLVGRFDEAEAELRILAELEARIEDPLLALRIRSERARAAMLRGHDLEEALHLLRRDRALVLEDEAVPHDLATGWLAQIATATHELGFFRESRFYLERMVEGTRRAGDLRGESAAVLRLALSLASSELPTPETRRRVARLAERSRALAETSAHLSTEVQALRLLGLVGRGRTARDHLERCVELTARAIHEPGLRVSCLEAIALQEALEPTADRQRIETWLRAATGAAEASEDPWSRLSIRQTRSRILWALGDFEAAVSEGMAALDVVEILRDAQAGEMGRLAVHGVWWEPYHRLAGFLFETASRGRGVGAEPLAGAFRIGERMRARALLEAIGPAVDRSARTHSDPPPDLAREIATLEQRRAALQRRLLEPGVAAARALESDLQELEHRADALRHRAAARAPGRRGPGLEALVELSEVEASLRADEALLTFQYAFREDLYGRPEGGSWLLVSTAEGSRSYPLPDRLELAPMIRALHELEDPEAAPELLVLLHRKLFAEALEELPATVRRLVLVADGDLHRLPFALLRPKPAVEAALASRFSLSFAPSATLWLHWRRSTGSTAEIPALVLAAPLLQPEAGSSPAFPPLPFALREGREVVRQLGGGSRLRSGPEASEGFLADHDLSAYAILHLAAHARVDPVAPGRSAILLAPGAPEKDGWLQPHEIVELRLSGSSLVVLGTCDSAAGGLMAAEGVMSLARAFFAAGARTVVASQRPLPDRQTSRLFEGFYGHLATGAAVGEALTLAQRERIRAGAPAAAWSSLVVLGDASQVPLPEGGAGRRTEPAPTERLELSGGLVLAGLVLAGLLLTGLVSRWGREGRRDRGSGSTPESR